ncbi:cell wall protein IFF6-like protein [Cinnamomum micranthum f. kanehirae]|uniref:Cell wall protein IFF6-like protein n=1 Tax=Cinnamomum micranthum f. kanehirae TaxID=337451 RepID=A0A3S3QQN7_9MAGN|nr:cell wall protein IFF6-like protein [Cinnamomum micranthum f. kanehirae]
MAIRMILSSFVAISMFLIASAVALPPFLSPVLNNLCDVMECGKGTCKAAPNQMIPFICECKAGWKQFNVNDSFRFMPCVIPDCTVNYSCINASTPAAAPPPANHSSIPDPCTLAYCGQGMCMKTSEFGHKCECADGSANLLNMTNFPCFNECALGVDCVNLGLGFPNRSSNPPSLSESGGVNKACSDLSGNLLWLIISAISLAMVA